MGTPLVSVIIRTYNRRNTIQRAIDSARAQTFTDREILVIDDGSTDDTEELLRPQTDLRYHRQPNSGIVGARKTGVELARGKYVALLDSDDTWAAGYLERMMTALLAQDAGIVFCDLIRVVEGTNETLPGFCASSATLRPMLARGGTHSLSPEQLRQVFIESMPTPSSAMILLRENCNCEWPGPVHVTDDWFMALEVIFAARPKGVFLAEAPVTKRISEDGVYESHAKGESFRQWFYADRELALRYFGRHLSPAERASWNAGLAEVAFDSGHHAATRGGASALAWYIRAFRHGERKRAATAIAKLPFALLRRGGAK